MVDRRPGPVPGLDAVELRQLRYFLAVARHLNFTRAAEELHLAQHALSASVARLEAQLGVPLFVRTTRKVALTSAGEVLVAGAEAVLAAAVDALAEVHLASQGRAGRLTVGFSTAAGGVGVVRDVLRAFAKGSPRVELETVEHDFADPSAGLLDGRTQAAFIFGPLPGEGLAALTLLEEPRLLAVAPDHPLAARSSLTSDDLRGLPWLRVPAPAGTWPGFWFPPTGDGPPGPVIRTADEWVTAIESGRGAAFTLPSVMRNFTTARVATVPVTDLSAATILLAWRSAGPDPLVEALLRTAKSVLPASRPAEPRG